MIENLFGVSPALFFGLTVVLVGGCAFMAGQAAATAWKPAPIALFHAALLGGADRFLIYGLFGGSLWSLSGYLSHTAVLAAIALAAHRLTLARRMVAQYPWLYRRTGPFSWSDRAPAQPCAPAQP